MSEECGQKEWSAARQVWLGKLKRKMMSEECCQKKWSVARKVWLGKLECEKHTLSPPPRKEVGEKVLERGRSVKSVEGEKVLRKVNPNIGSGSGVEPEDGHKQSPSESSKARAFTRETLGVESE